MYYYIKGTLALLAGDTAVIDAGGIGYRLTVTQNTFAALASKLGKEAQLFTYLAVRDDAMELYGFASEEEKLFFKAAFKNDDQNCLRDHDFQLITAFYTDQIESRTGKKISPHLQFQLEMYCQGSIFMTVQWVLGYRKCTPEELARSLAGAMPAELSDVFREVGLI